MRFVNYNEKEKRTVRILLQGLQGKDGEKKIHKYKLEIN